MDDISEFERAYKLIKYEHLRLRRALEEIGYLDGTLHDLRTAKSIAEHALKQ